MRLVAWDALPEEMRNEWVRPYYEALAKKRVQLVGKRCFDVALSTILLVLLSPAFLVLAIAVKLDSPGTGFLPAGTCHAVWEAIPYLQVSHYVRPSRPDGERGDHRR